MRGFDYGAWVFQRSKEHTNIVVSTFSFDDFPSPREEFIAFCVCRWRSDPAETKINAYKSWRDHVTSFGPPEQSMGPNVNPINHDEDVLIRAIQGTKRGAECEE